MWPMWTNEEHPSMSWTLIDTKWPPFMAACGMGREAHAPSRLARPRSPRAAGLQS